MTEKHLELKDYGPQPFAPDLKAAALANDNYLRTSLFEDLLGFF